MALQMLQHFDDLCAFHAAAEMPFINFTRERQPDRRREPAPFRFDAAKHRTFAARGPRPSQGFLKGKTKFIQKHDFCAQPPRFFLSVANRDSTTRESRLRPVPSHAATALAATSLIV